MNEPLVKLNNISAGYNRRPVLKDICLAIYPKDFVGIIGPNGGGKTTLLKVILGLLDPSAGEVVFSGDKVKANIGYMPQTNTIDKKFPITVAEVVGSGLMNVSILKAEKKEQVNNTLVKMGLQDLADRPIGELSGGERQRTLLGRAVINNPALLILDEPNSYVDKRFESVFYELLQEINQQTAIVLVSHDIGTIVTNVKNIACVNETLHYHSGADIDSHWIEEHLGCPFEIIGHGNIPHRILKTHE